MAQDKLNLTKQDAAYSPATVKQKVKQWQGDGGGVVASPDLDRLHKSPGTPKKRRDSDASKTRPSPRAYQSKQFTVVKELKTGHHLIVKDNETGQRALMHTRTPIKDVALKNKSPGAGADGDKTASARRRQERAAGNVTNEMKAATSPKKRVISDSHWRKDRKVSSSKPKNTIRQITTQKSTPNFRTNQPTIREVPTMGWATGKPVKEKNVWTKWDPAQDPVFQNMLAQTGSPGARGGSALSSPAKTVPMSPRSKPLPKTPQRTPDMRKASISSHSSSGAEAVSQAAISLATPAPDDSISRCAPQSAPERLVKPRFQTTRGARRVSGPKPLFTRNGLVTKDRAKPEISETKANNRIDNWLGGHADPFVEEQPKAAPPVEDRPSPSLPPEPLRPRKRDETAKFTIKRKPLGTSNQNRQFSFEKGEDIAEERTKKASPREKENKNESKITPAKPFWNQDRLRMPSDESKDSFDDATKVQGIGLGIDMRRGFPTTGNPLSTIASVVTQEVPIPKSPVVASYTESVVSSSTIRPRASVAGRKPSGLKRRLTKHDDLMTVLSATDGTASLVSARSYAAQRAKLGRTSVDGALKGLAEDEEAYQSDLRILVEGVVPALLANVLSRGSSLQDGSLFDKEGKSTKVTQPIVDMGVALERLRTQHKRIPKTDSNALIAWAQTAAKAYDDYIKAWRLGFSDVVVNVPENDKSEWHQHLPRNDAGDLLSAKGERLDVAFLLKRPLVRVKNLTKVFWAVHHCQASADAKSMAERYHTLVEAARRKSSDELARLEDEAAASIDTTRARDPKSLAPLAGVRLDQTRSVRARDYFEMNLRHSSGQQLDCAVEIFIRDNEANPDLGGDVLVCEVSDSGRWLLFPPFVQEMVSARRGKRDDEMIMMLRGIASDLNEWSETLTLRSESEDAVKEWADMLSDGPVPPSPTHTAFTMTPELADIPNLQDLVPKPLSPRPRSVASTPRAESPVIPVTKPSVSFKSRTPSPKEIEIPIGEQARKTSKRWSISLNPMAAELLGQVTPAIFKKVSGTYTPDSAERKRFSKMSFNADARTAQTPKGMDKEWPLGPDTRDSFDLRKSAPPSPRSDMHSDSLSIPVRRPSLTRSNLTVESASSGLSSKKSYSVWMPNATDLSRGDASSEEYEPVQKTAAKPAMHKRLSGPPSELSIPKARRKVSPPQTPTRKTSLSDDSNVTDGIKSAPSSAPGKLQKIKDTLKLGPKQEVKKAAETPTRPKSGFFSTPNFLKRAPRPSSPLKQQVAAPEEEDGSSDFCSDTEYSDSDSEYSADEDERYDSFVVDQPSMPLFPRKTPPQSIASLTGSSLGPSNSASQGPYRGVPPELAGDCRRTVGSIFSWSQRGTWDPLYPAEVSIFVTPGLIEAFSTPAIANIPLAKAGVPVSPSTFRVKPLIALELTPLVPLRRGTALDITIRSPPTASSTLPVATGNIMFRSRSPDECEALYNLINRARISNATYIALQAARPAETSVVGTFAAHAERRQPSFFGLGSRRNSTYRSNSVRKRATSAASESSVGTMGSAFSALRRLSGMRGRDVSTNSSGGMSVGDFTPGLGPAALGRESKIRLYKRAPDGRWRDMGSARLAVLLPESGSGKRVLVTGTTRGEILLDKTLPESAFERVARTGIAVSVWTDGDVVGEKGGVGAGARETYMVQMKSERDAAWTFGLVGRERY